MKVQGRPGAAVAAVSHGGVLAIEAVDLVKTYPGGVRALDGLTFAVEPGIVFGLLGPNGAGKSTAVKILTTLSRPDSGEAQILGMDVRRRQQEVRRAIGCVAQRSGVDPDATGTENLLLQGQVHGLRGRELRRRADDLLEQLGLTEAANRLARTYSGGMRRRLDLAMGLVHDPRVLFLDEPTTGLDPEVRADLWSMIERLARDEGMTVLLTTHYLEEVDRLASRMAIVDKGKVVVEGTPEGLKSELRGDAIRVELAESAPEGVVLQAIERLADVREPMLDGRVLYARADQGAAAVPSVLSALEARHVPVASVTVARPSLDDVYLRYVGRAFAAGGQQEGQT